MIKIRLGNNVDSDSLFDKIDDIKLEINKFYKKNNFRGMVAKYVGGMIISIGALIVPLTKTEENSKMIGSKNKVLQMRILYLI